MDGAGIPPAEVVSDFGDEPGGDTCGDERAERVEGDGVRPAGPEQGSDGAGHAAGWAGQAGEEAEGADDPVRRAEGIDQRTKA